jgi:hypothetical protein
MLCGFLLLTPRCRVFLENFIFYGTYGSDGDGDVYEGYGILGYDIV